MINNARRTVGNEIISGLMNDITAKEFYDGYKEDHIIVMIMGFEFKIFVDIQNDKPCFYPDKDYNDTFKIDSSKNFRKLSTCIKDIERQLKDIYKKTNQNINQPLESKKKLLKETPYYFEYFFQPEKELYSLALKDPNNLEIMEDIEYKLVYQTLCKYPRSFYLIKEKEYQKFNEEELSELYFIIKMGTLNDFEKEVIKNMDKRDILKKIEEERIDFLENSI